MQNGLPFHHGHLTSNPALAGKPLHAVDPSGELFGTFSRNQVIPGVVYVAAERTGPAEVTVRSLQKNTRYLFGTVDCMHGPNSCRAAALDAVIEALSGAGTNAWIVCIFFSHGTLMICFESMHVGSIHRNPGSFITLTTFQRCSLAAPCLVKNMRMLIDHEAQVLFVHIP